jgi:hypothetical protein
MNRTALLAEIVTREVPALWCDFFSRSDFPLIDPFEERVYFIL